MKNWDAQHHFLNFYERELLFIMQAYRMKLNY